MYGKFVSDLVTVEVLLFDPVQVISTHGLLCLGNVSPSDDVCGFSSLQTSSVLNRLFP